MAEKNPDISYIPTTVKNKALVEKRRDQIVKAAIKLFAQKGFHKTTLKDLADEAGLSYGNIYDYVGSKEDIFCLIHEFALDLVIKRRIESTQDIQDPIDKVQRLIREQLSLVLNWPEVILLLYQESHILQKPLLSRLLENERRYIRRLELILEECIKQGLFRDFNVRLMANLIEIMMAGCVLKQWDLKGHATQIEMEKNIIDLVFHGMLADQRTDASHLRANESLAGQYGLIVNGGNAIGRDVASYLVSRGMKLAIYGHDPEIEGPPSDQVTEDHGLPRFYLSKRHGQMTPDLFHKIEADLGQIDVFIHNLSISGLADKAEQRGGALPGQELEENLYSAQRMAGFLQEHMAARKTGRLLYLAPWVGEIRADPWKYQLARTGIVGLTQAMSEVLAETNVNVNCIIPGIIGDPGSSNNGSNKGATFPEMVSGGYLNAIPNINDTVYYLISNASKYVNGQVILVGKDLNITA